MTPRFIQSAPTERAFVTDKHWQTPWHREWIHGKVQPLINEPGMGGAIGLLITLAVAGLLAFSITVGLLGPHAATDAHRSQASGVTAASSVAGRR